MIVRRPVVVMVQIFLVLISAGCSKEPDPKVLQAQQKVLQKQLFAAVKAVDAGEVESCIAKGADLNEPEAPGGWYPLHYAARSGSLAMVMFLIEKGAVPLFAGIRSDQANDVLPFKETPSKVAQTLALAQSRGIVLPYAPDKPHRTEADDANKPQYNLIVQSLRVAEQVWRKNLGG